MNSCEIHATQVREYTQMCCGTSIIPLPHAPPKRPILLYLNNNHETCHHPTVLKKISCHACFDPMIHVIYSDPC